MNKNAKVGQIWGQEFISFPLEIHVIFESVCPPMRWADSIEDIPPWDWSQGLLSARQVIMNTSRIWKKKEKIDPLQVPRLVRDNPGNNRNYIPVRDFEVVHTLARLGKFANDLDFAVPNSKFRNYVLEAAQHIGLLRTTPNLPRYWDADHVHAWRDICSEIKFWKDLIPTLDDRIRFPATSNTWDGVRRDYNAFPSEQGDFWVWAKDKFHTDEKSFALVSEAHNLTQDASSKLEAKRMLAKYFRDYFFSMGNGGFDFSTMKDHGVVIFTGGAWAWAYLELSKLYGGSTSHICANNKCEKAFEGARANSRFCSKKCMETVRKREFRKRKSAVTPSKIL